MRKQGGPLEVTVYVDDLFEYLRIVQGGTTRDNNALHLTDNKGRIALIRVGDPFPDDSTPSVKYQYSDQIGSCNVNVDSNGGLINREE